MSVYYFGEVLIGRLMWYNQSTCIIAINIILLCLLYVYSRCTVDVPSLDLFSSMQVTEGKLDSGSLQVHCKLHSKKSALWIECVWIKGSTYMKFSKHLDGYFTGLVTNWTTLKNCPHVGPWKLVLNAHFWWGEFTFIVDVFFFQTVLDCVLRVWG